MTTYTVGSGVTSSGITLNNGDFLNVSSGGTASGTIVGAGGTVQVFPGGRAISTQDRNGGVDHVLSGGVASLTTVSSGGGGESIYAGGTAAGTMVSGNGYQVVFSGGVASNTVLSGAQGTQDLAGGKAIGTIVNGGADVDVPSGAVASGTVINTGGTQYVHDTGVATGTVVNSGGTENVFRQGVAVATQVRAGGFEFVSSGSQASGTNISSGGYAVISAGGQVTGATVSAGGILVILPGGAASGTNALAGGVVLSHGGVIILSNYTKFSPTGPHPLIFAASGTVSGGVIAQTQGEFVYSGGTVVSAIVSGSTQSGFNDGFEAVSAGGTTIGVMVVSGGREDVTTGGLSIGTVVASGGGENVTFGIGRGTVVSGGGVLSVVSGVTSNSFIGGGLTAGGQEILRQGGSSFGTTAGGGAYGGTQVVTTQGIASGTNVLAGGFQVISRGGVASGTVVSSGGTEVVASGGVANRTVLSAGGAIDISYLTFAPGGGASVNSATNVLTVVAGGGAYAQQLAGNYAGATFQVTQDGGFGTLVTMSGTVQASPTVTSVTASPSAGDELTGTSLTLTVAMSAAVTVSGGTPGLTLNDGGTATYDAAKSSGTALVFDYTVQSGETTMALAVTGLNTNGATIQDASGNGANFAELPTTFAGLEINVPPPSVTSVTASPSTGDEPTGTMLTLTVTMSHAVTVSGGPPSLLLNDGGTTIYDRSKSSATTLVFDYTVENSSQSTPALAVTGFNANGATIQDATGQNANFTAIATTFSGLQINIPTPSVLSVTAAPSTGDEFTGTLLTLTVAMTKAVTVSGGTPSLTLNDGGTATYDAAKSTGTALVFDYTVQSGQSASALAVTGLTANGATIQDATGNSASFTAVATTFAGLEINISPPSVTSVTASPSSGDEPTGTSLTLTVAMSGAVTVSGGTPSLALSDGGTAAYDAAKSSGSALVFDYMVQSGQSTAALAVTGFNANGATIQDASGNSASFAAVATTFAGLQINIPPPGVTSVTVSPSTGDETTGTVLTLIVTMSKPVTVSGGTPGLMLNDGGTATYDAARSDGGALVFDFTVQSGQSTAELAVTGFNANGATIQDANGNSASFAAVATTFAGLEINIAPPSVVSVTASPNTGDETSGTVLTLTVTLSGAVTVSGGTPGLALNDGGTATYDAAKSTSTALVFDYTVQSGQSTPALAVTGFSANGATIQDAAGNSASFATVATTFGGLEINNVHPAVTSVTASPSTGDETTATLVTLTVAMSEAVTVSGGTPSLTLNDDGTATYDAAKSSATALVFDYAVQAGQTTSALAVAGFNANGATIQDTAANSASFAGVPVTFSDLEINIPPPSVTSVTASPSTGDETTGTLLTLTVAMSEAVTVSGGTPSLALNDGGTATYDAAKSSATALVFDYTVQAGQTTSALAVTGFNASGATIQDTAGNSASFAAVAATFGGLQVNVAAAASVTAAYVAILRTQPADSLVSQTVSQIASGQLTLVQFANGLIAGEQAVWSTLGALVTIDACYNATPTSALLTTVATATTGTSYYTATDLHDLGYSDPNVWTILGASWGADPTSNFYHLYAADTTGTTSGYIAFLNSAYQVEFGALPAAANLQSLLGDVSGLSALLSGGGNTATPIQIMGGLYGYLLYAGQSYGIGHYASSADAFLLAAANGTVTYGPELTAEFPATAAAMATPATTASTADPNIASIAGSIQPIDRGTPRFLGGASDGMPASDADPAPGGNSATDGSDLGSLLSGSNANPGTAAPLSNYLTVPDQSRFDSAGFGGAGAALWRGPGGIVTNLNTLVGQGWNQIV